MALIFSASSMLAYAQDVTQSAAPDLATRRATLDNLIQQHWDDQMRANPEMASCLGDKRFNDKVTDFSSTEIARQNDVKRAFLAKFEALDVSGLSEQEKLNRDLMVWQLRLDVDGLRFKEWEMPVVQNNGLHIFIPSFVAMYRFDSVKDYEDYIARLNQMPGLFDQLIMQMQNGMRDGLMPPKFLLEKVYVQCNDIAQKPIDKSPFASPLKKMPASFSAEDKARLSAALIAAINGKVNPAYIKLAMFVKNDYAPKGRSDVGYWALPDGAAYYGYLVKSSITTDMKPEQIHQLGLTEVARIEAQMLQLAHKLGFADLKALNASNLANPALFPKSRQEIVDAYLKYAEQMLPKLPQLFGRLPKAKMEIRQTEDFREDTAPAAGYVLPSPDGRPGIVNVNTSNFAKRSILPIESTALHEGLPGHHLQLAIAQELPAMPEFRKFATYTAFVEGWALYAESLGSEVGNYQNPYSYYGHLQQEMIRAIRLVVDTGLHYKKWSRQQVIDYFHAHSDIDEAEIRSEADRYIATPGQALGYKIGQLKFAQLRADAKQELGARFDIRGFHDVVLGSGAVPLDILDRLVKEWIGKKKEKAEAVLQ